MCKVPCLNVKSPLPGQGQNPKPLALKFNTLTTSSQRPIYIISTKLSFIHKEFTLSEITEFKIGKWGQLLL